MNLRHIKSIGWEEVFSEWEKEEADMPRWIEHYKKRGFNSWAEWRKDSIGAIHPEQLKWNLYEVLEPVKTVSDFYAGPFRAWAKKYYDDKKVLSFKNLAVDSRIQNDQNINEIIKKFPGKSTLIGLIKNNKVIIIDGLHRCCALVVANLNGIKLKARIFIVCAEFPNELPTLGQVNSPT